jgi:hypothetical protein
LWSKGIQDAININDNGKYLILFSKIITSIYYIINRVGT